MKCLTRFAAGAVVLASGLFLNVCAESLPPGQVDFGTFAPPGGGGEFVEVNLSSGLISLAAQFVEKQEPDVAQVLARPPRTIGDFARDHRDQHMHPKLAV